MKGDNETQAVATDTAEKKVRKSPKPLKVTCSSCGKEAFSQSFKAVLTDGVRTYVCRRKGGCEQKTNAAG
jgi:hypothetical protein